MKKFFAFVFTFFLSLNVFAATDFSSSTLTFGASIPFFWKNLKNDDLNEIRMYGAGLDVSYRKALASRKFGFFVDSQVFVPLSISEYYSKDSAVTSKITDYEYFFGIDCLSGIYTVLHRSASVCIPFGLGLHLDGMASKWKDDDTTIKNASYSLGVGAWIKTEINISKDFGFFAGAKLAYDFYQKLSMKGSSNSSDSGISHAVYFLPSAGIVFHF